MWFRSLSAVFSQADPLGCFLLISKSVTTTSTEAAETLKGKLKFELNLEKKILCLCPTAYKKCNNFINALIVFFKTTTVGVHKSTHS